MRKIPAKIPLSQYAQQKKRENIMNGVDSPDYLKIRRIIEIPRGPTSKGSAEIWKP